MAILKRILKYLAYSAWFLVALVACFYWTLPFDQVQAYLVRKASDEYNADLEIAELTTWGLLGVEAKGVTLTPRPTPEQLAEIQKALEARKAWEAEKAARDAEKAKAKPDAEPVETADGKGTKIAVGGKGTKKAPAPKVEEEKPPAVPSPPAPVVLTSLRVGVDPWTPWKLPKVFDARMEAELLDGARIEADVERGAEDLTVDASWNGLQLAQISMVKNALPLPLTGNLEGEVDLQVPLDDKGKPQLTAIDGHVDLKLGAASLGPGRIKAKLGAFPYFEVPVTGLGDVAGRLEFEPRRRRATLQNFAFAGKDVQGAITGFVQLASSLERWGPRLHFRFKFSDAFVKANSLSALLNTRQVRRGMDSDGFMGLSMTGLMSKPQFRQQKRSPYVSASRTPKTSKGSEAPDRSKKGTTPKDRAKPKRVDRKPRRALPKRPPRSRAARVTTGKAKPSGGTTGSDEEDDEDEEDEDDEDEDDEEDEEEADDEEAEDEAAEDDAEEEESEDSEKKDPATEGEETE